MSGAWSARAWLFKAHLWTGLTAGAFLSIMGITGSILALGNEIEAFRHPQLLRVRPRETGVSLDQAASSLRREHPGVRIRSLRIPQNPLESLEFIVETGSRSSASIHVDPYTSRVLGWGPPESYWLKVAFALHANRLAGPAARMVNAILSVALLALGLTGLFLWWPGKRQFLARTKFPGRKSKRFSWDLHNAAGFWSSSMLILLGLTAISMIFYERVERVLHASLGGPRPPAPTSPALAGRPPLGFDVLLRSAQRAFPAGKPVLIQAAEEDGEPVVVRFRMPGDLDPHGSNRVYLDPATSGILAVDLTSQAAMGPRIFESLEPLHTGRFGGFAARALWAAFSLTPALLFGTGLRMWWRARRTSYARLG
jgi:uncharacterized iron-regulated membrane protein